MTKHFPQDMITAAKLGKRCFLSDIKSENPNDCENCGGLGVLVLFIATDGPYNTPVAPYRKDEKVSKWFDDKWWIGSSHSFKCPDCKGFGKKEIKQGKLMPVESGIESAVDQMTKW